MPENDIGGLFLPDQTSKIVNKIQYLPWNKFREMNSIPNMDPANIKT
jgi:hypothetical protein